MLASRYSRVDSVKGVKSGSEGRVRWLTGIVRVLVVDRDISVRYRFSPCALRSAHLARRGIQWSVATACPKLIVVVVVAHIKSFIRARLVLALLFTEGIAWCRLSRSCHSVSASTSRPGFAEKVRK